MGRTGVWLAGARGSVATTAITGALAIQAGLADRAGLVSEAPCFPDAGLPALADLVFGGHDLGRSDPLKTRRTAEAMLAAGFTGDDVDRVLWRNPVEFYGQSGRLDLDQAPDPDALFAGNSVLRGSPA